MSKTIDIRSIRKAAGLKASTLAEKLFPNHDHPYKALNYVENGNAKLNSEQLQILADLVHVPVGLLFDNADWHMSVVEGAIKVIKFTAYDFTAYYNYSNNTTTVEQNRGVLFEKVKHEGESMEISEYLNFLTNLIIKYKSK